MKGAAIWGSLYGGLFPLFYRFESFPYGPHVYVLHISLYSCFFVYIARLPSVCLSIFDESVISNRLPIDDASLCLYTGLSGKQQGYRRS